MASPTPADAHERATVRVIFLDDGSGEVIGRSDVLLGQLPEIITDDTRLQLGESHWMITHAEPARKAVFADTGVLRLRLRRLDAVDPRELLFSQPTICANLPGLVADDSGEQHETLRLHEDDWRQIEFFSGEHLDAVSAEIEEVRAIFDQHARVDEDGEVVEFDFLHTRQVPVVPLDSAYLSLEELQSLLPGDAQLLAGVSFWDRPGRVADSFAVDMGPLVLYGLASAEGEVTVLAIHLWDGKPSWAASDIQGCLTQLMHSHDLMLADWCRCAALPAAAIPVWLMNPR